MLFNIAENDDDSTMLNDENIQIYRIFEKTTTFDFDLKKKSLKFNNNFIMYFDNFKNDNQLKTYL